jgi:superfamily II DNA helicase RecQ
VLALSWARQRTFGGRVANRTPSTWLSRVERAIAGADPDAPDIDVDVRERIADARAHVSKQKSSKREVPEADAPLFAALVEWRRKLSRASGAPAYVVFHDTTLAAIASARPRTRVALLTVPGVGPVKAERYGDAVLSLVGEHASARATPAAH